MGSSGDRAAVSGFPLPQPGSREACIERRERELIAVARALGIPWERLVEAEIEAERKLRRFVGEPEPDRPLWRFLSALPTTALDSWRVRERLAALLRDARLARSGAAVRSIREAIDELCGKRPGSVDGDVLAAHLRQAHERVRELARVARAAERARGDRAARLARVVARTGCTGADAAWAIARAEAPGRAHAIDDAVRQARAEGFEIPVAESEFHSFLALRKLVRSHAPARRRSAVAARRVRPSARRDHRLAS
ncbi:MAG: hypothetical protein ACM3SU_00700 [Acidobacteriota bacterium]